MANRSYLYALDFNPNDREKQSEDKISSVGEYNYGVPLAYKILLSQDSDVVPSLLFDYPDRISVIGDFSLGREKLYQFLDQLKTKDLFEKDYLDSHTKKTKEFLNGLAHHKYFFLENAENFFMSEQPAREQNLELYKQISNIDETIERFYESVKEQPDEKNWLLGINHWSDSLYYNFK